jgi:hypothetical protein
LAISPKALDQKLTIGPDSYDELRYCVDGDDRKRAESELTEVLSGEQSLRAFSLFVNPNAAVELVRPALTR